MYYHCSLIGGLKVITPAVTKYFDKSNQVFVTTNLSIALLYSIINFEYTCGYEKNGKVYFDEYYPNAFEMLYKEKKVSLYICEEKSSYVQTENANEYFSNDSVAVIEELVIYDVYEKLLELEKCKKIIINHYADMSNEMKNWIVNFEKDIIIQKNALNCNNEYALYLKTHYAESWKLAEAEMNGTINKE
ncbi:MAG: hypothetical protein RR316_05290 [Clostridia bacterium]